jgi:DNA invertase Pin-like site-specific DNA recombinase
MSNLSCTISENWRLSAASRLPTNTKIVVFAERRRGVPVSTRSWGTPGERSSSLVLVAAFDRIARSTRNFLQIVDELDSLGIEFISRREGVATGDAMGRLFMTIISAIAELERSLVVERVKSGMRRARLEGRQIGRARLDVDRGQVTARRIRSSHASCWRLGRKTWSVDKSKVR